MKSKVFQRITMVAIVLALIFAFFLVSLREARGEGEAVKEGRIVATKREYSPKIFDWQTDIYVMGRSGKNPVNITKTDDVKEETPSWSPDGEWIAFSIFSKVGGGIFVIKPDGTGRKRLTDFGYSPKWSFDGSRILFSTMFALMAANGRFFIMNNDGTGLTGVPGAVGYSPSWSPDGKSIAYTADVPWGIAVVDIKSGVSRQFTDRGAQPLLSPDGTKIVFVLDSTKLLVLDLTSPGNNWHERTKMISDKFVFEPIGWTNDGRVICRAGATYIVFINIENGESEEIFQNNPDSGFFFMDIFGSFDNLKNDPLPDPPMSVFPKGKLVTTWGATKSPKQ